MTTSNVKNNHLDEIPLQKFFCKGLKSSFPSFFFPSFYISKRNGLEYISLYSACLSAFSSPSTVEDKDLNAKSLGEAAGKVMLR